MDKYISVEKLRAAFLADLQTLQSIDEHTMNLILLELDEAPMEDVAPVVHGHWQSTGLISCRCSECQHLELKGSMEYLYCPHCGAKMDKEDEDL